PRVRRRAAEQSSRVLGIVQSCGSVVATGFERTCDSTLEIGRPGLGSQIPVGAGNPGFEKACLRWAAPARDNKMASTGPDEKKSVFGSLLKFRPAKRAGDFDDGRPKDREAIQAWLINKVSAALSLSPDHIDPRETFSSFGLDSRTAVSLSG